MNHSTLELNEITLRIGRLFMAGLPGTTLDSDTKALIREAALGGIILFARNIEGPEQLAALTNDLQTAALESQGTPLFIAVDQEGGRVARLQAPFSVFPGNEAIGRSPQPEEAARAFARTTAREMRLVGLNMDLAPVVDVRRGEAEKHLAGRTFGEDPNQVGRLGSLVIRELQANGVMAVAKHFPGLGRTGRDPHLQLPTIPLSLAEMEAVSLPPFAAGIAAGVSGIMSSHAVYPALDEGTPATLSPAVLTGLLRERMGFEGLIITDDLEMGAITGSWGVDAAAERAFAAGADILLICRNQQRVIQAIDAVQAALLEGRLSMERLHASNRRIEAAKERYLKTTGPVSLQEVRRYFA
ncbi:Glycosyl hydrolase family 3 N-terminal domain protein [uncultured Desulfatiglans sp.]|nr:Glycosyl hydrolase family 3 N-terminal domain protein [uncultured Desulfatiglans sp.]